MQITYQQSRDCEGQGNAAPFEKMWQVIGNNVSNLTGPKFKPQTSLPLNDQWSSG